jgi:hypothetical protein
MLLTESKLTEVLTEGMKYHLDTKTPLYENVYRPGSEAYFSTIKQARYLMNKGILTELCLEDMELLFETEVGEFGIFEGKKVPLDFPMINEIAIVIPSPAASWKSASQEPMVMQMGEDRWLNIAGKSKAAGGLGYKTKYSDIKTFLGQLPEPNITFSDTDEIQMPTVLKYMEGEQVNYKVITGADVLASLVQEDPDPDIWVVDITEEDKDTISEAKYQGKEVALNKPKRGGPKKFYVYTKNPKTGKVIKVNFGDTTGLKAKINNSKARKAFSDRHNCPAKKDKTKAGYWSCRLPRYASLLGLKSSFGGYW